MILDGPWAPFFHSWKYETPRTPSWASIISGSMEIFLDIASFIHRHLILRQTASHNLVGVVLPELPPRNYKSGGGGVSFSHLLQRA